jgi:hypothetical protein
MKPSDGFATITRTVFAGTNPRRTFEYAKTATPQQARAAIDEPT